MHGNCACEYHLPIHARSVCPLESTEDWAVRAHELSEKLHKRLNSLVQPQVFPSFGKKGITIAITSAERQTERCLLRRQRDNLPASEAETRLRGAYCLSPGALSLLLTEET